MEHTNENPGALSYGDYVILQINSYIDNDTRNPHTTTRKNSRFHGTNYTKSVNSKVNKSKPKQRSVGIVSSVVSNQENVCFLTRAHETVSTRQTDFRKCIFQIMPSMQYIAKRELHEHIRQCLGNDEDSISNAIHHGSMRSLLSKSAKSNQMASRSSHSLTEQLSTLTVNSPDNLHSDYNYTSEKDKKEKLEDLSAAYVAEKKLNESSMQRSFGHHVAYGASIQLRHVATNRYLTLDGTHVADLEPDCLRDH
jgi:hypothetical protein